MSNVKLRPLSRVQQQKPVSMILNMRPVVLEDRSPEALRDFMIEHRYKVLPVVADGRYVGVVRRPAMLEAVRQNCIPEIEHASRCAADETIHAVATRMVHESSDAAICVDEVSGQVKGMVTLHDLFRAQSRAAVE